MADIDDEIAELRARLAKLEAQRATQASAAAPRLAPLVDAPVSDKDKATNRRTVLIIAGVATVLGLAIFGSLKTTPPASDPKPAPADVPPGPIQPLVPREPAAPPTPQYAWTYTEDVDAMSDRKTRTACVDSTDTVNLDWPYKPTTAELCIRNSPKFGIDVFFQLNGDGQILCDSYNGCSAKIRYGDAPAGRNGALSAADHSSNIIFLTGARAVAARLATTKTTKVELSYYQAGVQAVTFPTEGLDLAKVGLGGGGGKKKG